MRSGILVKPQLAAAADALAATTPFATAKVHLAKNTPALSDTMALGDLVEADFVGYAAEDVTWGGAVEQVDNSMTLDAGLYRFDVTMAGPPQTVSIWYVTNAAGNALLAVGQLDAPVTMATTLDSAFARVVLNLPPVTLRAA